MLILIICAEGLRKLSYLNVSAWGEKFLLGHRVRAVCPRGHQGHSCLSTSDCGDLPSHMAEPVCPFLRVGVDQCGFIWIKSGCHNYSRSVKAYITIFVCYSTKAVHTELVSNLTTVTFIAAFKKSIAKICLLPAEECFLVLLDMSFRNDMFLVLFKFFFVNVFKFLTFSTFQYFNSMLPTYHMLLEVLTRWAVCLGRE